jgi:putative oxidoreductase
MSLREILFGQLSIDKKSANFALFLIRFYAGFTMMSAGLDKLPLTDWMVDQVISMGFPFPTLFAWIATFSEFAFGLLLVLGLLTRTSALVLAITMGVAAFGFHKVLPLVDMHITQYFFWIFVLFIFFGAGKYSIDYYLLKTKSAFAKFVPAIVLTSLIIIGLYIEFSAKPELVEEKTQIASISVAGSFNEWDPTSNEMSKINEKLYELDLSIEQSGLIEFKFIVNKSWDINFGEENQSAKRFPVSGIAELDDGSNTSNIKAYIPNPGNFKIIVDAETYAYSLDSVSVIRN